VRGKLSLWRSVVTVCRIYHLLYHSVTLNFTHRVCIWFSYNSKNKERIFFLNSINQPTNPMALEPEGSSSHSLESVTGLYPEPLKPNLPPPASLPKIHSDLILSSTVKSSECSLSFDFPTETIYTSLLSHACHMSHPPHSSRFDLTNDIWRWIQVMKLLIRINQLIFLMEMYCVFFCVGSKFFNGT
jgi:hypothetical protein